MKRNPLPYAERLEERALEDIRLIVIHCTELPDLVTAREYGERIHYEESGTGNSGHFYIDRDGRTEQWVPLERVAHHVRGHNPHSVGIELVNRGRYPDWLASHAQQMTEPYPKSQMDALIDLLKLLHGELPQECKITGHENLDRERVNASDVPGQVVRRKRDPGPLFPWEAVRNAVPMEFWDGEGQAVGLNR
jgi:N-acetylmuramoyl-L-alanine amidase